jgi:hypothetical protein
MRRSVPYIRVSGYRWPIKAGPEGVDWVFDPAHIDTSSGEPIVRIPSGYWVWGRGCTQPGGGIAPAWGFVRSSVQAHGDGLVIGHAFFPPGTENDSKNGLAAFMRRLHDAVRTPRPPTRPPPFGNPPGHIGGSYDWWWWHFGRPAGMRYAPPRDR